MDGQERVAPFDIGADEISASDVKATVLEAKDVGVEGKK